jgi:hypothetical protein
MEDNPRHSNDAYKDDAHSPALSDTSFHTPNFDGKEPIPHSITLSHTKLPQI